MSSTSQVDVRAAQDLRDMNYIGVAAYTMLIYDHLLTLGGEMNYIWKGKKGPIIWLFFLNRYFPPIAYAVILLAYNSPMWTPAVCDRFVAFQASMAPIVLVVAHVMMLMRIRALYHRNKLPSILLGILLFVETGMGCWLASQAQADYFPAGMEGCGITYPPSLKIWTDSTSWIPTVFQTAVFVLTLRKTLSLTTDRYTSGIVRCLLRDGIIYYFAVTISAIAYILVYIFAREGLKNILEPLAILVLVTMTSRITLNLRQQTLHPQIISEDGIITTAVSDVSEMTFEHTVCPKCSSLTPSTRRAPSRGRSSTSRRICSSWHAGHSTRGGGSENKARPNTGCSHAESECSHWGSGESTAHGHGDASGASALEGGSFDAVAFELQDLGNGSSHRMRTRSRDIEEEGDDGVEFIEMAGVRTLRRDGSIG